MISDFRIKNTPCKGLAFAHHAKARPLHMVGLESTLPPTTYHLHPKKGVAALLTIVIVSASALIMAISSAYLSLGELDQGFSEGRGNEALFIATGCMDEALERLRKNSSYTGGNLTQSNGSCIISIATSGSISTTTVTASTTSSYWKKLESVVTISSGVVSVNSWQEKDD
jgi:hypothetical protein